MTTASAPTLAPAPRETTQRIQLAIRTTPEHTATTLRVRDGQRLLQDGPFADTKEQLGGYFVIDVPNLDAALGWAQRCPAVEFGAVEVRPLLPPPAGD